MKHGSELNKKGVNPKQLEKVRDFLVRPLKSTFLFSPFLSNLFYNLMRTLPSEKRSAERFQDSTFFN